ncbi:universal stress protein [Flavobacterium sp. TSSA_36]|uniref:universal stress protein n=1 Tax=Flavobacterium sp. TSSA_36 TaxID=3447669 RepID=UPI003F343925
MKRILVPTDFSVCAENALKVAAQLAKKNHAEIFVLHMLELPNQMSDAISNGKSIPEVMFFIQKAKETMTELLDRSYLENIKTTEFVQFEKAFDGIITFTKKNNIDLIVMGSNGSSGTQEIFVGSNTEKVVRLSEIPVLVIKKETPLFNPKEIVFASDFTEITKAPFRKIKEFADQWESKINLVSICTPNSFKTTGEAISIMNDFAKEFNLTNFSINLYNESNVEKGILNFANSTQTDLISICTHGRTGLSHFFNGSITEDLVNHTQFPVMTVKS